MKRVIVLATILLSTSTFAFSSTTTQDSVGNGVTTRYSDGSVAQTRPNDIGGGYTTTYNQAFSLS